MALMAPPGVWRVREFLCEEVMPGPGPQDREGRCVRSGRKGGSGGGSNACTQEPGWLWGGPDLGEGLHALAVEGEGLECGRPRARPVKAVVRTRCGAPGPQQAAGWYSSEGRFQN